MSKKSKHQRRGVKRHRAGQMIYLQLLYPVMSVSISLIALGFASGVLQPISPAQTKPAINPALQRHHLAANLWPGRELDLLRNVG